MHIGICEDDQELRELLRDAFVQDDHRVRTTATGGDAVREFGADPPDVLVLDIGLPDADGRDVCQALRARGATTPVLFLTAHDTVPDRVSGFTAGGDDYLTKPFAIAELRVRLQALVRRAAPAPVEPTQAGFRLDPTQHAVRHGDHVVALTPTEFRLLAALAASPGAVVRRRALVAAAWPDGAMVHDNTLDAYLARIRRKLRAAQLPEGIETVRGVGYALR